MKHLLDRRYFLKAIGLALLIVAIMTVPGAADTLIPPPPDTTPEVPDFAEIPPPDPEEMKVTFIETTGEATKGSKIVIADTWIQLPPDAYIAKDIMTVTCVIGNPCPETPLYVIARGESKIAVSSPSGIIYGEEVGLHDPDPFAFIKEALGEKAQYDTHYNQVRSADDSSVSPCASQFCASTKLYLPITRSE
ncbi:MAG: hypothetical protein DCC55_35765 [Chloroflexi bacterium]|nr:MAG: hypothetical protein DCC55_35765 [Chloroflexota bacterium]